MNADSHDLNADSHDMNADTTGQLLTDLRQQSQKFPVHFN